MIQCANVQLRCGGMRQKQTPSCVQTAPQLLRGIFGKPSVVGRLGAAALEPTRHRSVRRVIPRSGFNLGSLLGGSTKTDPEAWWKMEKDLWVEVETMEDYERELVNCPAGKLVAIDWYATWCQGCKKTYPELCKIARDPEMRKSYKFVKICIDNLAPLARKSGITALPRMSVFIPGEGIVMTMDATYSKSKNIPRSLRLVLDNPNMAFVNDPNGIPMAVAKVTANKVAAANAEAVKKVEESTEGLQDLLMAVANNRPATATAPATTTNGNGNGSSSSSSSSNGGGGMSNKAVDAAWPASLGLGYHYVADKNKFLKTHGNSYGYNGLIDTLYPAEVAVRMAPKEHYMDYTGSSVYCQSQLKAVFDDLQNNMFGNPHSANPSSMATSERIEDARLEVLRFFKADPAEYQVIFTRSATGALKMVGETFPWEPKSKFRYLRENHNSVLGIREYALTHGSSFQAVDEDFVESWLGSSGDAAYEHTPEGAGDPEHPGFSLFAFPAEDNYAGVKYPLSWVSQIRDKSTADHRWMVLLDAAAYVGSQPLDLSETPADFVDVAFYKMFGYPTGLGALIVRVEAVPLLRKVFWGGGTVALSTSKDDFHVLKCRPSDKLEDGTVAFLDILSLHHGFQMIKKLGGMQRVQAHVAALTSWTYTALAAMKHPNGKPLLQIFGKHHLPNSHDVQGGIFNFEVLKPDGSIYSYKTFEREAAAAGFHVRTGAACNPGACYASLGVEESELESLAGVKEGCEDDVEFVIVQRPVGGPLKTMDSAMVMANLTAKAIAVGHPAEVAMKWVQVPLGSIRISLGYMSTFEDCWAMIEFLQKNYVGRE